MKTFGWSLLLTLAAAGGWAQQPKDPGWRTGEASFDALVAVDVSAMRLAAGGNPDIPATRRAAVELPVGKRPSQRYESRVDNPDGSTTIIGPRFAYVSGEALPISSAFSKNAGVCRLF